MFSAASWDLMSPQFCCGIRQLSRIRSSSSRSSAPARKSRVGGDPEPLLVDLRAGGRDAPGHLAADVGAVDEAERERNRATAGEDRLPEPDVREMRGEPARGLGIVGDADVSRRVGREAVDHVPGRQPRHGAHRRVGRGGEHLSARGHQAGAEVLRLLDEDRERGAQRRRGHLLRDRLKAVAQHLEQHRVGAHRGDHLVAPATAGMRSPSCASACSTRSASAAGDGALTRASMCERTAARTSGRSGLGSGCSNRSSSLATSSLHSAS